MTIIASDYLGREVGRVTIGPDTQVLGGWHSTEPGPDDVRGYYAPCDGCGRKVRTSPVTDTGGFLTGRLCGACLR